MSDSEAFGGVPDESVASTEYLLSEDLP